MLEELRAIKKILNCFVHPIGLQTNPEKTEVYPVRCEEIDISTLVKHFLANVKCCPYKKIIKGNYQPLIDKKVQGGPLGWKEKQKTKKGRVSLTALKE